jgi:hypothetical protein
MKLTFADLLKDSVKRENKNIIIIIVGDTRSGKSWMALSIGESVDPHFSEKKVTLDVLEYINLLDRYGRGSCIILDDAGYGMPAREWQDVANRLIAYTMETIGYKNQIIIWTVPDMGMVDRIPRKLFHYCLWQRRYGVASLYEFRHDRVTGKTWRRFPIIDFRGRTIQLTKVEALSPSAELTRRYEESKAKYLNEDRKEIMKRIKKAKGRLIDEKVRKATKEPKNLNNSSLI